jgi:hypothetical protein
VIAQYHCYWCAPRGVTSPMREPCDHIRRGVEPSQRAEELEAAGVRYASWRVGDEVLIGFAGEPLAKGDPVAVDGSSHAIRRYRASEWEIDLEGEGSRHVVQ